MLQQIKIVNKNAGRNSETRYLRFTFCNVYNEGSNICILVSKQEKKKNHFQDYLKQTTFSERRAIVNNL
jgi:hypothetical protein